MLEASREPVVFPTAVQLLGEAADPVWLAGPGAYQIPVRRYGRQGRGRPVVMLHGLESHSGWFVQSARRISARGLPVHAFDRCGSGVSRADPALGGRLSDLLAEVDVVANEALAGTSYQTVHVVGHCFGALVALLYAALYRPQRVASLVLATPALYTRTDLALRDKLRVAWSVLSRRPAAVDIPLAPEEFSELACFVELVRRDPLALRSAPAELFFAVWRARFMLPRAAAALRAPLLVALAGADVICDNARNRGLLQRVTGPKDLIEFPRARHILEFSEQREAFLGTLASWLERREVVE